MIIINYKSYIKNMKILAHSKEHRGNELIVYQFKFPTYLLPEILYWKNKMEVTWKEWL